MVEPEDPHAEPAPRGEIVETLEETSPVPSAFLDLPRRARTKVVMASLMRSIGTVVVLAIAYAVVPFDHASDVHLWAWVLSAIVLITVALVFEIRMILSARFPGMKAIEALIMLIALIVFVFSATYVSLSQSAPGTFSEPINKFGGIYFTVTVLSTVGFGDITARTNGARMVVVFQMLFDIVLIGAVVRLLFSAARTGQARRAGQQVRFGDSHQPTP